MLPNQMFNAVLSSLRTFDPLSDTLDILIISFVFYQLPKLEIKMMSILSK